MQATGWSRPRSQRFKPAAPCEACDGPDSTAMLSQAQVPRSDLNHSIGIVILATCPVLPQRVRGKRASMRRIVVHIALMAGPAPMLSGCGLAHGRSPLSAVLRANATQALP